MTRLLVSVPLLYALALGFGTITFWIPQVYTDLTIQGVFKPLDYLTLVLITGTVGAVLCFIPGFLASTLCALALRSRWLRHPLMCALPCALIGGGVFFAFFCLAQYVAAQRRSAYTGELNSDLSSMDYRLGLSAIVAFALAGPLTQFITGKIIKKETPPSP